MIRAAPPSRSPKGHHLEKSEICFFGTLAFQLSHIINQGDGLGFHYKTWRRTVAGKGS